MPEDKHNLPNNEENSDVSPSAMFLEMMRQAALRETDGMPPIEEAAAPSFDQLEFRVASDDASDEQNDEVDTYYIPESELFPDAEPAPNDVRAQIVPPISDFELEEAFIEDEPVPDEETPPQASIAQGRVPIYTAPPADEDARAAQLEAQRVRRLKRRQQRRQRRRVGIMGAFFRTAFAVIVAAALASTIFTWFTDPDFFNSSVVSSLQVADATSVMAVDPLTPTAIAVTPNWARRIGIVSGHRGPENDPGAVCDDGLTEAEINFAVAQLVVRNLRERGYSVDLLDEFDPRLDDYQAAALVSIHSNDCTDYGEFVSGYLVARAAARPAGGLDDVLAECIARDYGVLAQIERRFSLTIDMTDYHTFREIHPLTPAAILELGFMRGDRELLTTKQDLLAQGITSGILCYLNGENPIQNATEVPPTSTGVAPIPLEQATANGQ